jgi:hypothetical protein
MKKTESAKVRVQRFLAKMTGGKSPGWSYAHAPDPRQQAKVEHPMAAIMWSLELALLSNQPTLRDAEEMTESLGSWVRRLVPEPISDTTLDTEAQRLDADYLLEQLVLRVRGFHRSKMLEPVGLPSGVVTVDGKNLATLDHDADGTGHARSSDNEKWHLGKAQESTRGQSYFLMPALRATLSSAEAKPCIYQLPLPVKTGEATVFAAFLEGLHAAYGRGQMFDIIDADAGLTSLANANRVVDADYDYVFGLKGNQAELFCEAQKLLEPMCATAPEAESPWESRNGKRIRRRLWRTAEMAGFENSVGKWTHLCQTWLVRQQTRMPGGTIEVEDRYFVTSLPWDRLSPQQILLLVRNHWAVENDCFNSLDLQWHEDAAPWCTRGTAVWALGVLRLLAYNTAQVLRRRRLCAKREDGTRLKPMAWRSLFKTIARAIELLVPDIEPSCSTS